MAISYPRTLPTAPSIKSNRMAVVFNVDEMISPVTLQSTFDEKQGHRWEGMFTYPPMLEATAREWKAWFASMHGPIKEFYAYDPDIRNPLGTAASLLPSPSVVGASQTGRTVNTGGWGSNRVGLLLPGDHFHIGTELKEVTERVDSDGTGLATINFEPPFHVSPANGAPLVYTNPRGVFRMVENSVPWESDEFGKTEFAFAFVESF